MKFGVEWGPVVGAKSPPFAKFRLMVWEKPCWLAAEVYFDSHQEGIKTARELKRIARHNPKGARAMVELLRAANNG